MNYSMFDRLNVPTENVLDTVFGHEFAFEPRREVKNGTSQPDTSRNPIQCFVALDFSPSQRDEAQNEVNRVQSQNFRILAKACIFGGPKGVKRLDQFIRKQDGQTYEVRAVRPEGITRISIEVVEL